MVMFQHFKHVDCRSRTIQSFLPKYPCGLQMTAHSTPGFNITQLNDHLSWCAMMGSVRPRTLKPEMLHTRQVISRMQPF